MGKGREPANRRELSTLEWFAIMVLTAYVLLLCYFVFNSEAAGRLALAIKTLVGN